jgi:predicted acyltransferase
VKPLHIIIDKFRVKPHRLLSLDVFRGLTTAAMILVNSPGNQTAYWPLEHAEWNGLTPTDLVFPFFLFIVGMSLVLSLGRRLDEGEARSSLFWPILRRTLILFGLGLLLNGFPHYSIHTLRIPGVLQRIAICYFIGALFYLWTRVSIQMAAVGAILLGYWWVMTHLPVPGFSVGDLSREGNVAAYIDRLMLGGHLYRPIYDPEGILSTLPAAASVLLGNLAALWLRQPGPQARKASGLLQAGFVCLLAGWKWGYFFPLNKALWTSSYVLVTTGWALVTFGLCYVLIEMAGWTRWAKPLEVFGTNAIAAYFLHVLFLKIQNLILLPGADGQRENLRLLISGHLFGSWLSPQNASMAYASGYTLFWFAFFWTLYRRKLFLHI